MKKIALSLVAVAALAACNNTADTTNDMNTVDALTVNEAVTDVNAADASLNAADAALTNAGESVENAAEAVENAAEATTNAQ